MCGCLLMGAVPLMAQTEDYVADSVSVIRIVPQDRTDTIYYNKNWHVTTNRAFANYYRLALYPADSSLPREYKTYYISGELQGEGGFVELDKADDAKSVFDGECVTYYKNGQVAEKKTIVGRVLHGDYTTFYESGLVKEHVVMVNNLKDGLHTAFSEDGQVCRVTPYRADEPEGYYVVIDFHGNYSKFDLNTNEPILEPSSLSEMQTEYKNGVAWHYYNKNGLIVGVSNAQQKELGGYRELGVFIVNKSMMNVDIDPDRMEVYNMKNGKRSDFKLVDADEYDKKILKQKKAVAKRDKHKKKVKVVYEHENNVNANLGAREFGAGTSNTLKTFQARMTELKKLEGGNRMHYAERLPEDLGYLERTTVHPGEIMTGYLYTSDRKAEDLFVKVNIGGIDYLFEWKTNK